MRSSIIPPTDACQRYSKAVGGAPQREIGSPSRAADQAPLTRLAAVIAFAAAASPRPPPRPPRRGTSPPPVTRGRHELPVGDQLLTAGGNQGRRGRRHDRRAGVPHSPEQPAGCQLLDHDHRRWRGQDHPRRRRRSAGALGDRAAAHHFATDKSLTLRNLTVTGGSMSEPMPPSTPEEPGSRTTAAAPCTWSECRRNNTLHHHRYDCRTGGWRGNPQLQHGRSGRQHDQHNTLTVAGANGLDGGGGVVVLSGDLIVANSVISAIRPR